MKKFNIWVIVIVIAVIIYNNERSKYAEETILIPNSNQPQLPSGWHNMLMTGIHMGQGVQNSLYSN